MPPLGSSFFLTFVSYDSLWDEIVLYDAFGKRLLPFPSGFAIEIEETIFSENFKESAVVTQGKLFLGSIIHARNSKTTSHPHNPFVFKLSVRRKLLKKLWIKGRLKRILQILFGVFGPRMTFKIVHRD